jgi:hypothetical protein
MKNTLSNKRLLAALSCGSITSVWAHEGHGLLGAHWHASDAFGFVALAAAIGLAVWISRK